MQACHKHDDLNCVVIFEDTCPLCTVLEKLRKQTKHASLAILLRGIADKLDPSDEGEDEGEDEGDGDGEGEEEEEEESAEDEDDEDNGEGEEEEDAEETPEDTQQTSTPSYTTESPSQAHPARWSPK